MKGWKVFRGKKMRIGKWRRALKIWRRRHLTLLLQNVALHQKMREKRRQKHPKSNKRADYSEKKRKKCRRVLANRILLSNFANSKKTPLSSCRCIAPCRRAGFRTFGSYSRPASVMKQNILLYICVPWFAKRGGVKSLPKTIENSNCAHASPSESGRRSMRAVFIRAYLYIY